MSMSQLRGIIESHKGEDLCKLKTVVLKLDVHLKNTNAKLASLRHQIRLETNPKSRETYLKKSHTMVWEQQTIRRILEDYKKKLIVMVSNDEAKTGDQKQRQVPVRNAKLFELFKNTDSETEKGTAKDETVACTNEVQETESSDDLKEGKEHAEKRKISGGLECTTSTVEGEADQIGGKKIKLSAENSTSGEEDTQVTINTQAEAFKHLAALQEYTMLNDNFRATGLLVQVEKALKNPPNSTDFEL